MSIDTLVAERVMGYKWYRHKALTHEVVLALPVAYFEDGNLWEHNRDTRPNDERDSGNAPHFSTDISAAWEVVEEMDNRHFGTHITRVQSLRGDKLFWAVDFNKPNDGESGHEHDTDSAPLAICLAALRAVGVSEAEIQEAMK